MVWVSGFMGVGLWLNISSGVTGEGHHSQLMLPTTTTTTTTLFLPDSRARMGDRVREKQGKEQNRRVKSKAS